MKVCSYFNGGDCVTIEQYVLENVQVRNPCAKIINFYEILARNEQKKQKSISLQEKGIGLKSNSLLLNLILR